MRSGKIVNELATRIEQQTQVRSDAVVRRWPRVISALVIGAFTLALVVPFVDGAARWFFTLLTVGLFSGAAWEFTNVPFRRRRVRDQGDALRHEAVTTMEKALSQCEHFLEDWHDAMERLDLLTRWGEGHQRN